MSVPTYVRLHEITIKYGEPSTTEIGCIPIKWEAMNEDWSMWESGARSRVYTLGAEEAGIYVKETSEQIGNLVDWRRFSSD